VKIAILGAGVIGVTSAYYLAEAGHEVTVVERQDGAGLETSFANAGEISPGYASPWAGPGVPVKAVKWLLDRYGPLVIRPRIDPAMWRFMARMLRNCTSARYAVNKSRMVPLAEYSRDRLRALRADIGIAYDERSRGTLQLFRDGAQLKHIDKDIDVLRHYGVAYEVLDCAGCVAAEPGLATACVGFAGGLRLPGDETGDCHMFTQALARHAADHGVRFRYATSIQGLTTEAGAITGVVTSAGALAADAYVVALGSYSPLLLGRIGIDIPVYPVKGYSLTLPVTTDAASPVSTVMDEQHKVAITRLGDRIRVGGTAELGGYNSTLPPSRRATLERSLTELFPNGGDLTAATFWSGLRPMTPDGPPVIGATRYRNLYLNPGHGTLGWTMACGSACLLRDLIAGKTPEFDHAGLGAERYG
jgi:D-amino-acid dehydrogenase